MMEELNQHRRSEVVPEGTIGEAQEAEPQADRTDASEAKALLH